MYNQSVLFVTSINVDKKEAKELLHSTKNLSLKLLKNKSNLIKNNLILIKNKPALVVQVIPTIKVVNKNFGTFFLINHGMQCKLWNLGTLLDNIVIKVRIKFRY